MNSAIKSVALAAAAATAFAAAPAFAQDAVAAEDSWTGFYVGGRAGFGFQPSDGDERLGFDTNADGGFNDTVRTTTGADAFATGFCGGAGLAATAANGCRGDKDAVTYAGHLGFDYQIGRSIVLGAVAEYGNSNINDSVTGFSTTPANYVITRSLRGIGSARARAGFSLGRTLLYGTGGFAYGKVRTRYGTTNNANSFIHGNGKDARQTVVKDDRYGYTYGGGIEQKVARNFSIGLLYLYTSLDDDDYRVQVGRGTAPATNPFLLVNANGTTLRRSHTEFNRHDVTVTASFRF